MWKYDPEIDREVWYTRRWNSTKMKYDEIRKDRTRPKPTDRLVVRVRCSGRLHTIMYVPNRKDKTKGGSIVLVNHDDLRGEEALTALTKDKDLRCIRVLKTWREWAPKICGGIYYSYSNKTNRRELPQEINDMLVNVVARAKNSGHKSKIKSHKSMTSNWHKIYDLRQPISEGDDRKRRAKGLVLSKIVAANTAFKKVEVNNYNWNTPNISIDGKETLTVTVNIDKWWSEIYKTGKVVHEGHVILQKDEKFLWVIKTISPSFLTVSVVNNPDWVPPTIVSVPAPAVIGGFFQPLRVLWNRLRRMI